MKTTTPTMPTTATPTDDEIMFLDSALGHAIDAMTADDEIKETANRLAELNGCAINSRFYFMIVGFLAGMDEGAHIMQVMNDYEKETATPTDESKDCR